MGKGVDMTKAAVSRDEVIRKYGSLQRVKKGTGARSDDVLMSTSQDFAVLGNTVDPQWGVQYKTLGQELEKKYNKQYIEGDSISEKSEELNTANSNQAFDELLQRQEISNQMQGKGQQQYQDTNNAIYRQANGGYVPRYEYGSYAPAIGIGGTGAAITALGLTEALLPKYNTETEAERKRRLGAGLGVTGIGAGGMGLGAWLGYNTYRDNRAYEQELADEEARIAEWNTALPEEHSSDWEDNPASNPPPAAEGDVFDRIHKAMPLTTNLSKDPLHARDMFNVANPPMRKEWILDAYKRLKGEELTKGHYQPYKSMKAEDLAEVALAHNKLLPTFYTYGTPDSIRQDIERHSFTPQQIDEFKNFAPQPPVPQSADGGSVPRNGGYTPSFDEGGYLGPGLMFGAGAGLAGGGVYAAGQQNPILKGIGTTAATVGSGLTMKGMWGILEEYKRRAALERERAKDEASLLENQIKDSVKDGIPDPRSSDVAATSVDQAPPNPQVPPDPQAQAVPPVGQESPSNPPPAPNTAPPTPPSFNYEQYDRDRENLLQEQEAAYLDYYRRVPRGAAYRDADQFNTALNQWRDEGMNMMNHYSQAMDAIINSMRSSTPKNADGGQVSRFANGGYFPAFPEGGEITTAEDAVMSNTAANDPQTLMQLMMQNNMDPELKKRLIDAATSEMKTKALSGIPMMMGEFDKDTTPERTRGHYVGAATNPYAGVVTDAMMGNMPTMAPYQSEANANLSRLMQSAGMTSNAGARNMAMANSMMAHNAMMNSAQRQVDAMRMSQSAQYGQTMAGIGAGDQQAINAASQFNAQEGARVDDLDARARAKARDNEYNNRVKHLFGAERAGAAKDDLKDLWGQIKEKATGWGKQAAELANTPTLKKIVEKVVGKEASNEELEDAYYSYQMMGGYEGSFEDFKKMVEEAKRNDKIRRPKASKYKDAMEPGVDRGTDVEP